MSCNNVSEQVSSPYQAFLLRYQVVRLWSSSRQKTCAHMNGLLQTSWQSAGDEENRFHCSAETQVSTGGFN